jgi:hypothetical protein
MFLPFIIAYAVILILPEKNKIHTAVYSISSLVLGFGASAFFLIPAFMEGKYTLRDIVTKNEIFNRFETLSRLLFSPWNHGGSGHLSVQVGILHWAVFITASIVLLAFFLNQKAVKKIANTTTRSQILVVVLSIIFFAISIFLMLPISKPIYVLITTLQKFQFPWRFLSLAVFTSAILGGFVAAVISHKKKALALLIGLSVIVISIPYWQPDGYIVKPASYYTSVYPGTTDTGESAPVWSVRFMEKEPAAPVQIVEGEGSIGSVSRINTRHTYTVQTVSENTRILENTLYFPGWKVFIDGEELPSAEIFFQDSSYRGLINFYIDSPGVHEVKILFTETKLRFLSNLITIFSGILIVAISIHVKK